MLKFQVFLKKRFYSAYYQVYLIKFEIFFMGPLKILFKIAKKVIVN